MNVIKQPIYIVDITTIMTILKELMAQYPNILLHE